LTPDEILFDALALDGPARDEFVAQACLGDAALRAEVESLVAAHEQAGRFLREPALSKSGAASCDGTPGRAADPESWVGRQIGAYRVKRVIGSGGMGTVLLAVRADEQFRKRVAIKVIRAGIATDRIRRRFSYERQVLARLDHPNVARLIDGGLTDDGLPYLVMDYVEGLPIDVHCGQGRLSVAERLRLFQRVCAPVQHAHQHLVVHRDLKPGNILITSDGEPRLLDFGIAKVLDSSGSVDDSYVTVPALRLFTPRYASPEQLRGQPVTTASDVYSLGVILYELLTGLHPFELQTGSVQELEQLVFTKEPTRPSTAIKHLTQRQGSRRSTSRETGSSAVAPSDDETRRLRRHLSGDLDNILLMALRREPERRYASVAQFADDIRRHLEGLPVMARSDTWRYRAAKFIRRNAVTVSVAGILLVGLLAASITSTTLYFRAQATTRQSETQRAKAEQINRFLEEMLASIDPAYARGRDVTVIRQVVDQAAHRIDTELAGLPEVAASLHLIIGEVYAALASHEEAERHIRRSIELGRTATGADGPEVANSLLALAILFRDRSRYDEAEPLFRESLRVRERAHGMDHPDVAEALVSLGVQLEHTGRYADAEAAYRRALGIQERHSEADPIAISTALSNLGLYLMYQNRESEAEDPLRQALEIRRTALGDPHVGLIDPLLNLAGWHRRVRRFDDAEPYVREAVDICRSQLAPDHPKTLNALGNLAALYQDMSNYQAAEPVYRETVELQRRVNGEMHKETATTTNNLASLLRRVGKREEAVGLFANAADVYRHVLGDDHYWVSIALNNQAATLVELERYGEAEPLVQESLRIRRLHKAADWQIADAEIWLAACLADRGERDEAESILLRELAVLEKHDVQSRAVRDALTQLVKLYDRWKKPDRAAEYRARLLATPQPH
jgi:serine/threonine-protein kinase